MSGWNCSHICLFNARTFFYCCSPVFSSNPRTRPSNPISNFHCIKISLSFFTKVINAFCTVLNQIISIPYRLGLTSTLLLFFFFRSITVLNYSSLQQQQCCEIFRDKTSLPTTTSCFIVSGNFNSFHFCVTVTLTSIFSSMWCPEAQS